MSGRMLFAAERGDIAGTLALLQQGAEIDARDEYGYTALIWAVRHGSLEFTQAVLALGPLGWGKFLAQTRLVDRVRPRLRLALAGALRG